MTDTDFAVPPGTAEEAKASMVDALVKDVKAADEPPEYPEGAPEFYELMRVPYRRRATAIRKYGEVQDLVASRPELVDDGSDEESDEDKPTDFAAAADKFELVAILDEFLESVAVDPAAYEAWPDRFDVELFMQAWSAYQATQPGEAPSSSS